MKALILNNIVVDVSTQEFPVSKSMSWVDCPDECESGWKIYQGQVVEFTPDEVAENILKQTQAITDHISAYRRIKENGVLTVSGVTIKTDTETRASLLGAVQLGTSIDWKTNNGFVTLTAQQISAIATAVGQHIQKCFTAEKIVSQSHTETPYESITAIETAFDTVYEAL